MASTNVSIAGVFWIMEAFSFFVAKDSNYFIVTDVANMIQGVLIFITLVINSTVKNLISQRLEQIKTN